MSTAVASARIRTSLNIIVPIASERKIRTGSQVLFYLEKLKAWEGPYKVVAGDEKILGHP